MTAGTDDPLEQKPEDRKSILVSMLPEALQLAMKPHLAVNRYEDSEKELMDHIAFTEEQSKARKSIRAVTIGEDEASKKGEQEEWYDESGKKWLSMAVTGEEEGHEDTRAAREEKAEPCHQFCRFASFILDSLGRHRGKSRQN